MFFDGSARVQLWLSSSDKYYDSNKNLALDGRHVCDLLGNGLRCTVFASPDFHISSQRPSCNMDIY